ncbi:CYFA0S05e01376g1_1 [Cyberlindnera fabianii]|uniref:CYFA0S05e01376g1_1 n=1 Tax=Cyberlindnera fabianii TaxID=36022 RepID=A0A061ATP1_CYBFA|nr:Transcriptional activator HAP3 [Cyberlindnera fabianii]CDR40522.1 CYFA0S05e01376g1_1 [Cyberlindnera fabianii]
MEQHEPKTGSVSLDSSTVDSVPQTVSDLIPQTSAELEAAAAEAAAEKQAQEVELREQDRWLPIANVARLMKNTLPTTAKVSKDAKECMQECVSEFISFITSEASDKCLSEKRKTINGEDILFAMSSLGFENYSEVLKIYLAKYREQQALKQERGEAKRGRKQSTNSNNPLNIYEQHQQLQREITNIPLNDENEIDMQDHLSHDIMDDMKVEEDQILNLPDGDVDVDVGSDDNHNSMENGDGGRALKSEEHENNVLYQYTNEQY